MMQPNEVVRRALDALRAAGISESLPPRASKTRGWLVNGKVETVFPHCPACASYALYRKHNRGSYECMSCGLTGIDESVARRIV